jgi:branched-chain amino acid transport system substrate-binding protein
MTEHLHRGPGGVRWRVHSFIVASICAVVLALGTTSVSAASGLTSSAPGVTPSTISIGFIASMTGVASGGYATADQGALARIDLQNAMGGVDGRKLKLVVRDDTSSPTTLMTDASELAQNTFGVIPIDSFTFEAAPALQKEGVPVTGYEVDGPEWGLQPYTNMFSFTPPVSTPYNGVYYTYGYFGKFLKSLGVTKLANLTYSISPSAIQAVKDAQAAASQYGISDCYDDLSVPFGATDFTSPVLTIKQNGCNGLEAPMVDNSDVALAQAIKNAGLSNTVKQLYYTGYGEDVLDNPSARASYEGAYISTNVNFTTPNPAVQKMLNALKKYIPTYQGPIPDYGEYNAYIGMDLMIKGLELAGRNPTRQSFIANLHKVTDYTAEGIFPEPGVSFSLKSFGTVAMLPRTACEYIVQLKGDRYVVANGGKLACGPRVAVH